RGAGASALRPGWQRGSGPAHPVAGPRRAVPGPRPALPRAVPARSVPKKASGSGVADRVAEAVAGPGQPGVADRDILVACREVGRELLDQIHRSMLATGA